MTTRFAGDKTIKNGAFKFVNGKIVPTENTKRIMEVGREYNPDLKVRPYNSVEAFDGVPIWGTGGGYYDFANDPNTIHVDPIAGDTHVVAHEVGHAVAPSELAVHVGAGPNGSVERFGNRFNPERNPQHPYNAPARSGARVRAAWELTGKERMVEEASAQGFAIGVQHRLGIPYTNKDWKHVYDYPLSFYGSASNNYVRQETGGKHPNPEEVKNERIRKMLEE